VRKFRLQFHLGPARAKLKFRLQWGNFRLGNVTLVMAPTSCLKRAC
jgi:hypothetical protein